MGNTPIVPYSANIFAGLVRNHILNWFGKHQRAFPWRDTERTIDPYVVFVSEVMLQQTQTSRVVEQLPRFLSLFPSVHKLASASQADVIRAWQGMGYNRRALNMQRAAAAVVTRFNGKFPVSYTELRSLPGIGDYTARAILCFAFNHDVAVIDVNVRRVLSRLFYKCHTPSQVLPDTTVLPVADYVLPVGKASTWNQALMDLGSFVCSARKPQCSLCPAQDVCLSAFPVEIDLFHEKHVRKPEPLFRNVPRRLWRGKLLQMMRVRTGDSTAGELIAAVAGSTTVDEQQALIALLQHMVSEGLLALSVSTVHEGVMNEYDVLRLPE